MTLRQIWVSSSSYTNPIAAFKINGLNNFTVKATTDSLVHLNDLSNNKPNSWRWSVVPSSGWSFSSGSANTQNTSIKFNKSGLYTVSLTASKSMFKI